jgi:hypothetical protein
MDIIPRQPIGIGEQDLVERGQKIALESESQDMGLTLTS